MEKLEELYNKTMTICSKYVTTEWSNGWVWKNKGRLGGGDILLYHFLIQGDSTYYSYTDSVGVKIVIELRSGKYRIDIKNRYDQHSFWYFDQDKFKYVSRYVLCIVSSQYASIVNFYDMFSLCGYAYNDVEPSVLYESMNKDLREDKLGRIINE